LHFTHLITKGALAMKNSPHLSNTLPETEKNHQTTQKPKLLNQVRNVIRTKHYSIRTEQAYTDWINDTFVSTTGSIRKNWGKK